MGICYRHGSYEDTTAPGCPMCREGSIPDCEPDDEPPCPECARFVIARLRAERDEALALLREWRETPFFETEDEWKRWVRDFRPRVDDALLRRSEGGDEEEPLQGVPAATHPFHTEEPSPFGPEPLDKLCANCNRPCHADCCSDHCWTRYREFGALDREASDAKARLARAVRSWHDFVKVMDGLRPSRGEARRE